MNAGPFTSLDLLDLSGRVALVTGASGGLGAHFARVLGNAGAHVALAGRSRSRLDKPAQNVPGNPYPVELDVRDNTAIGNAVSAVVKALGPIDILVNNAGIARSARFANITEVSWSEIMDTNLSGMFHVSQTVARHMLAEKRNGSIINIASILGVHPGFGQCAYSVSKAGVIQLTRSMALELGTHGIRVNALCPGYFKTDMNREFLDSEAGIEYIRRTPAGRVGQTHELDIPLLMLASDAGGFINGAVIPVDGGHLVQSL
ncbi:MAG: SDR family oxidoreductase [Gammaproteobacteria bacterium]|nr:SDR family oxidoreductase [Gammaproteobacteria bacterium]MYD75885.1 SDR family oxidoreductase [Gammaproteobacteria bacterium]MYJ52499.1 SDR family oxidoreductase [Gammaproteobacteria bacterium]